jgi:hypothetical protein
VQALGGRSLVKEHVAIGIDDSIRQRRRVVVHFERRQNEDRRRPKTTTVATDVTTVRVVPKMILHDHTKAASQLFHHVANRMLRVSQSPGGAASQRRDNQIMCLPEAS